MCATAMPSLPTLNSLGKLCGSGRSQQVDRTRIKRTNSIKRMSVIEDGRVAEVLYLIPKQSVMQQLPFINPDDYYLTESLTPGTNGCAEGLSFILFFKPSIAHLLFIA